MIFAKTLVLRPFAHTSIRHVNLHPCPKFPHTLPSKLKMTDVIPYLPQILPYAFFVISNYAGCDFWQKSEENEPSRVRAHPLIWLSSILAHCAHVSPLRFLACELNYWILLHTKKLCAIWAPLCDWGCKKHYFWLPPFPERATYKRLWAPKWQKAPSMTFWGSSIA